MKEAEVLIKQGRKEAIEDEIKFLESTIISGRSLEKWEDAYMEVKSRIEERLDKIKEKKQ